MNLLKLNWKIFILFLAFTYGTSCQKSTEQFPIAGVKADNSTKETSAREKLAVKKSKILKIIQYDLPYYYVPVRTGVFEYNKWGDPVRILFDFNSSDDNTTNWIFRYNQKHQLTDAIKSYTYVYFLWSKYVYDHKGTIIRDTTLYFGQMQGETPLPGRNPIINYYTYDNQDRIIKVHSVSNTYSKDFFYNYDSNGNLERTGFTPQGQYIPLAYDDKVNPQRTNQVFMFVARDYSRNNAMPAESYNDEGLPLMFRTQGRTVTFLGANMANADILYEQ